MKLVYVLCSVFLMLAIGNAQTYLSENFEGAWSGSPEAPSGWTQSRVVLIGNGIPDGISTTSGEKDWQKNTNTGTATWSLTPGTPGIIPNAAYSGTGVAWLQSRDFGGSGANYGSRRLESPSVDLSSSTSPYVRFFLFWVDNGTTTNLRVMISSDNGANWKMLSQVMPNFTTSTVNGATPWARINVKIPAAFRTANMKIGIELSSAWGTNNLFLDDVSVEEFTPTTITSAATGNWSSTSSWVGGVVPSADNDVVVAAGHTIGIDNPSRAQNVTVNGTLQYSSTTTSYILQMFENLTVASGGTYKSLSGTTGKRTYLGGNLTNNGTIDFGISATSTSEAALIWFGYGDATFTNSGTISFDKINTIWHAKDGSVTYNSPVNITTRCVLGLGTVNPNGNLTLGVSSATTTMTIERLSGSFSSAPIFGAGVTRAVSYLSGHGVTATLASQVATPSKVNTVPGEEIESISGVRTVTGTLLINTHGNVELNYPLRVGNGTTGALSLTRGIVITTPVNILHLASNVNPPASGVPPSPATPSLSHGSYISGPLRIDLPLTATSRSFALGRGTNYNDSIPTANINKPVTLNTIGAWPAGISVTLSIAGKPSGTFTGGDPSTNTMGTCSYYLDLNGGSDLPATASISINANNYTYGNGSGSDSILGNLNNMRIIQSSSLSGPWTSRSAVSGTGSLTNNTNYSRTSATVAPGPIAPIAANGGYFAWGTDASGVNMQVLSISPSGASLTTSPNAAMTSTVKNAGLFTTSTPTTVTRTITGTGYSDTKTVAAGLAPNANAVVNFADFTGWTSGTTYTIKDSLYIAGDTQPSNDTLSGTFSLSYPKTTLAIYGTDIANKDSLTAHFGLAGLSSALDVSTGLPNISLSAWRTVVFIPQSGYNLTTNTAIRDSLKTFLDNANNPALKKSLVVFGNDIAYYADPIRNVSATPADTVFLRQYLRAKYVADDWIDIFVAADSTYKGYQSPSESYSFNSITSQRVPALIELYPDAISPAYWNEGSGVLQPAMIPITESGNGDTCVAVAYTGQYYNVYYQTNIYRGMYVSPIDGRGSILNAIRGFIEGNAGELPVELTSFTGSIKGKNVNLRWETATEANSFKFFLERSVKEGEWSRVAEINAAGNSNSPREYTFTDKLQRAVKIYYRLKMVDNDGSFKMSDAIEVNAGVPAEFSLSQNYPNPFNPSTKVDYQLPADARVSIELYSITGERIAQLVNAEQAAGYYTLDISPALVGKSLASGIYLYKITAVGKAAGSSYTNVKKMIVLR